MEFKRRAFPVIRISSCNAYGVECRYTNILSRVNQNPRHANNPRKRHYICAFTLSAVPGRIYRHYSNFALPTNLTIAMRSVVRVHNGDCIATVLHAHNGAPIFRSTDFRGSENVRRMPDAASARCRKVGSLCRTLVTFAFREQIGPGDSSSNLR